MAVFVSLAIVSLVIANIIKVLRFNLFIDPYEKPDMKRQTQALAVSNVLNTVLPLRLGYIVRILIGGKNMKNGRSFMLAATVAEIVLDFVFTTLVFIVFAFLGAEAKDNIIFYAISLLVFLAVLVVLISSKKKVKHFIYKIASIFNKDIALRILKTSWFSITSLKDIVKKVDKVKLLVTSFCIWSFNILSCFFVSEMLKDSGKSLFDVLNLFFSNTGITNCILFSILTSGIVSIFGLIIYLYVPSIVLFLLPYVYNKKYKEHAYLNLLPHQNAKDKLEFLKLYFNSDDDSVYFKKYLSVNSDVAIIEDYSAGSNATTMLCMKGNKTFYRKYAFGKDAAKLYDQVKWIHKHEKKLMLTKITNEYYKDDICLYDMPYIEDAVTCFNYVHTQPFDVAWSSLKNAIVDLSNNLHKPSLRPADAELTKQYIETKVNKNIKAIKSGAFIAPLQVYDYLYINGKKYHNLKHYEQMLSEKHLLSVFKNDQFADIHGDFTIENIVCVKNSKSKKNHYLIDPNTGNLHDSPYLDFGKLLQSLHGGYEFLMNTKSVSISGDHIDFLATKSSTYYKLCDELVAYLKETYGDEAVKSIFYHEIIHWLRLMPYKIEKNGERSVLFYAGLLMVLDDVEKRFKEKK